ncbi:hypothetical protein ACQPYH_06370 [Kribbella sp. CA-245084]|uniref:hypothetical protein n=1 Tax=Kribbella sp. CA-245084 TaxID=3239940 RepID=UPI003D8EF9FF
MDVTAAALQLYGLPPEEFIAARNQYVQQAKDAGDTRASAALKALRKPTLAAWLANTLVRADPGGVDELTELGEQLRDAHRAGDGRRLRELTLTRHGLVRRLVLAARAQARAQGHTVSTTTEQRLTETLDAVVIDLGAAQLLRTGQLTSALRHVGFGVVDETGEPAELAPVKPRVVRSAPPAPATKPTRKTARRRAPAAPSAVDGAAAGQRNRTTELRGRAQHAEREYADAETERAQAQADLDAHEHHLADLETTIEQLIEQLDQARQQLRAAHRRTRALQVELNRTTRNATAAQQRRDASQHRLADLDQ